MRAAVSWRSAGATTEHYYPGSTTQELSGTALDELMLENKEERGTTCLCHT